VRAQMPCRGARKPETKREANVVGNDEACGGFLFPRSAALDQRKNPDRPSNAAAVLIVAPSSETEIGL